MQSALTTSGRLSSVVKSPFSVPGGMIFRNRSGYPCSRITSAGEFSSPYPYSTVLSESYGRGSSAYGNTSAALGYDCTSNQNNVTVGYSCTSTGASGGVAIGASASNGNNTSIVLGGGVTSNGDSQFVCGGTWLPVYNVFFGKGVVATSPVGYTINGTGGSGSNVAGASLTLAGGKGTGTGVGGDVVIQVAAAGSSGSSLNSLTTIATFSPTTTNLLLNAIAPTVVPLTVRAAAAHSANVTELQNSSSTVRLSVTSDFTLRLHGSTSGYVGLKSPASPTSVDYTLPSADGTTGQVLQTNGSAVLSWTTAGGGATGRQQVQALWN